MAERQKKTPLQRKAEKKLRQVLEGNEKLIATLAGYPFHAPNSDEQEDKQLMIIAPMGRGIFGLFTYLYIGLTNQNLLIIEENIFGQRQKLERVPIKQLKWAIHTPDKPTDKFSIYWDNQHIDLFTPATFSKREPFIIAEIIQKNGNAEGIPSSSFHSSHHPLSSKSYLRTKTGNLSTTALFMLFFLGGLAVGMVGATFFGVDSGRFDSAWSDVVMATSLILLGFPGYFIAIRKELPYGFIIIRGKIAVLSGLGCITVFWGPALLVLISVFR